MHALTRMFEPAGGVALMSRVPMALTIGRLALAPVMLVNALAAGPRWVFAVCLIVGVLSDIFDGVIARRLRIDTPALRRFDSATDVVFWLTAFVCLWIIEPKLVVVFTWPLVGLVLLEVLCNTVSLVKFRRPPSTHAYSAKLWGLALAASLTAMLGFGTGTPLFVLMLAVGYVAQLDVLTIMWLSKEQPIDVAGFWKCLPRST